MFFCHGFLGSGGGVLKAHVIIPLERCEPIYNENNRHHLDFSVSYYMRERVSELYKNLCVSLLLCAFLPQKFWCLMFDVCMRYWSVTEQIRPLFFYDLYYINALLAAVLIQTQFNEKQALTTYNCVDRQRAMCLLYSTHIAHYIISFRFFSLSSSLLCFHWNVSLSMWPIVGGGGGAWVCLCAFLYDTIHSTIYTETHNIHIL